MPDNYRSIRPWVSTTAELTEWNPVLKEREIVFEKLSDGTVKVKFGDGVKAWAALPYAIDLEAIKGLIEDGDQDVEEAAQAAVDTLAATVTLHGARLNALEANKADRGESYTKGASDARYAPTLTEQASGASVTVSDAAAGFGMQRAAATGVTAETGTGDKAPGNPYTLSGAEPSKVRVCGKNLLDLSAVKAFPGGNATFALDDTKQILTVIKNTSTVTSSMVQIKMYLPAGTYYIKANTQSSDGVGAGIAVTQGDTFPFNAAGRGNPEGRFAVTQSGMVDINFYVSREGAAGATNTFTNVQLEQGAAATSYEPYSGADYSLPTLAPLYSVGDVCDEYDAVSGVETRRIGVKALDGTESWAQANPANYANYTYLFAQSDKAIGFQTSLCSHFINTDGAWAPSKGQPGLYTDHNNTWVIYFVSSIATIAEWKAWLAAQKEAGTPVTIVYVLAEPVTIQHDPQDIAQPGLAMTVTADGGAGADIRYSRDLNAALLDQIEYATALEARIAQLEILANSQS